MIVLQMRDDVPVTVGLLLYCQRLFHYPSPAVLAVCLHTSSVAPSQQDLSSEPTQGRVAVSCRVPASSTILQVALATHVSAFLFVFFFLNKTKPLRAESKCGPGATGDQEALEDSRRPSIPHSSLAARHPATLALVGQASHHRGEPGHRSHLVVLRPGLQILQREERRVVQAKRVRWQRWPQRPRQRVLLQVQQQATSAVPLGLAFLRRLAPGRAESRGQRAARSFPATRPARAPRLTATWCVGSGTRS